MKVRVFGWHEVDVREVSFNELKALPLGSEVYCKSSEHQMCIARVDGYGMDNQKDTVRVSYGPKSFIYVRPTDQRTHVFVKI